MSLVYVWTVTETGPFQSEEIKTMKWRCQRITDEGEITESSGDITISTPVLYDVFKDYLPEQVNSLLFQYVDKAAVEAALNGQSQVKV